MKELSIEERAQRYDEAIERAKKWYNAPNVDKILTFGNRVIEEIFPELKESGDERIRKFLHHTFTVQYLAQDGLGKWHGEPVSNILAWLEKQNSNVDNANKEYWRGYREGKQEILDKYAELERQGEKDINDEVKPKFREKDWIIDKSGLVQQVLDFRGGIYTCTYNSFTTDCESNYRLWTIEDAKDGDVLELDCGIGIFKDECIDGYNIHCYCYYSNEGVLEINKDSLYDTYQSHPATKEQRDQLEKAMADAGYTFDFEKKELKKISQRMISAEAKEAMYGKPAWSEEDDDNMMMIEDRLRDYLDYIREDSTLKKHIKNSLKEEVSEYIDWLKSIKQRIIE